MDDNKESMSIIKSTFNKECNKIKSFKICHEKEGHFTPKDKVMQCKQGYSYIHSLPKVWQTNSGLNIKVDENTKISTKIFFIYNFFLRCNEIDDNLE